MSTDKMRDDFRAWLLEVDLMRDRKGLLPITGREANLMEQAWQASRAALVVDIPPRPSVSMFASIGEARCAQEAHDRVVKAIEEAGVRAE